MEYRTKKNLFREKMKQCYKELNDFHNRLNKVESSNNKITSLSKKNEKKIRLFDKVMNSPSKQNRYHKNIIYLIEEAKRDNLGYKSFLSFNNEDTPNNNIFSTRFNRPNKFINFQSPNSSFTIGKSLDNISRNYKKRDNLKKEIMTQLENDRKKNSTLSSSYYSFNKSFRDF